MNPSKSTFPRLKMFIYIVILSFWFTSCSQDKTLAEKLGYSRDTKMLIMHADDIGMAYSVNKATVEAFNKGGINSASIMVPCPWFKDIASYINDNPKFDFGLHLTLTAEWENYKWSGVLPPDEIPGLLSEEGYFYASVEEVVANATPEEVESEIRAQVQRAIDFGIQPTHLDSHMGTLFNHPEFFKAYQKVGKEFNIPVFIPINMVSTVPQIGELIDPYFIPVNALYMASPDVSAQDWSTYYSEILRNLKPGLNEIIVHLSYDKEEMQAICVNHPDFGSAWRQRDLNYVLSEAFKKEMSDNNIQFVTYKQIQSLLE